jgi:hypothetical protein
MRLARIALVSTLIALGALASAPASAHHGAHVRFGVVVGGPLWYPYYYPYYPYPYAYPYYPAVVAPAPQTHYVEQGQEGTDNAQDYWYYCNESKTYYPYVKDCPGGWQRVAPQATPAR